MSEAHRKKRVLVCGATGFIGRNIAERLVRRDEYHVVGLYHSRPSFVNPKIQWVYADLRNPDYVSMVLEGVDIVIQAAAVTTGVRDTFGKPYYHITDNVIMNALLFRALYELSIPHFVFLSCSVMYDQTSDLPLKEDDFNPVAELYAPYFGGAKTKLFHEDMCRFYSRFGRTRFTVVRHSNIYGPYDKFDLERSHVFGATITKVLSALDGSSIVVWGDGSEKRDFLFVSDLVDFVELALEKDDSRFGLYNVGLGKSISVGDLVRKVIFHSDKNLRIDFDLSKPQVKTKLCLDTTRAKEKFDWSPKISLDEGILRTIEWCKNNIGK